MASEHRPRPLWLITTVVGAILMVVVACGDGSAENVENPEPPALNATLDSVIFCSDLADLELSNPKPPFAAAGDLRTMAGSAPSEVREALRQIATTIELESRTADLMADPRDAAPAARLLADYAIDQCDLSVGLFEYYRDRTAPAEPTNGLTCLRLAALRPITIPTESSAALVREVASQVGPELRSSLLVFAEVGDLKAADIDAPIDDVALAQAAAELSDYTHSHCTFEIGMVETSLR